MPGVGALGMLSRQHIANSEPVLELLESPLLFALASALLGAPAITTGYKWLRAVAEGEFTGVHTDRVFLGRGKAVQVDISLTPR